MNKWTMNIPFESANEQEEIWTCKDSKGEKEYNVEVRLGKPIDILALKQHNIEEFGLKVDKIKNSRVSLFKTNNLQLQNLCPICKTETTTAEKVFNVYGADYVKCKNCSHHYVEKRLSKKALEEFYSKNKDYQETYADKKTTEARLQQVAIPKAKWVIQQFEKVYGRKPKSILDVGAGSGHFVKACKDLGIETDGIEISKMGRDFCKNVFGFELINKDFIKEWETLKDYEIITFWGIIEHVPEPMKMLNIASRILYGKTSLIIVEVPRWNCVGVTTQKFFPNSITRHLDPLGHISCFTDSSLATAFKENNFDIIGAWYCGLDAYELITQIAHQQKDNKVIEELGKFIPPLQERLDLGRLSDEMMFAGIPSTNIREIGWEQ